MTSASSLHFGPEWMRKPSRGALAPLSPNPSGNSPGTAPSMLPTLPTAAPALPAVSSYSSLLTSASPPPQIKSEDESYPFRYSKDQLLRVWKDGGGRGGLGLEVERWPGIVREVGGEPLGVKEMTPEERKLFSTSVNSEPPIRRNTNNLSLAPDRQNSKFGQGIGIGLGPASPRGMGASRRRGTGNADDPSAPFAPRKLSLSSTLLAGPAPNSPGGPLASPNTRTRLDASDPAADPWARGQPANPAETVWNGLGARRRTNEGVGTRAWANPAVPSAGLGIGRGISFGSLNGTGSGTNSIDEKISPSVSPGPGPVTNADAIASAENDGGEVLANPTPGISTIYSTNGLISAPPGLAPEPTEDLANLQWSYKDPTGQIQGPFLGTAMQQWFEHGYFSEDLLIKRNGIDLDFEPLRDFRRRAAPLRQGEVHAQIFLLPLAPRAPPSLPPPQAHLLGNNTPPNPSPRLAHLMTGVHDPTGPMSAGVNGSPLGNNPALPAARSTTLDSYLSPSLSNGLVGSPLNEGLVVGGSALSNEALVRKKREDFIQSLRERELAMGVGTPVPQPLGNAGPFSGGFVPNPVVHHTQYPVFSSGNGGLAAFGSRLNMPIPPTPQPVPVSNIGLSAVSPFPHSGPVLWSSGDQQLNTPGSFSASPGFDNTPIYQAAPQPAWQETVVTQEQTWDSIPEQHDLPPAVEAAVNVAEELQTPVSESQVHESPSSLHPSLPAEPEVEHIAAALEETTIHAEPVQPREATPEPESAPAPAAVSPTPSSKRKNTGKGKAAKEPVAPATVPAPTSVSPVSPPAPTPAKAWATADEEKPTSLSLREIQEAEARKAEATRKATKVTAPTPVASDEPTNVTGSWGLPQVGARSTAPPAPAANGAPAWTKPATTQPGKKSMKEIQDEEEKRKKAAAAKEAQSIAAAQAKRAYAESAKNVSAPAGGAWTTVGAPIKPPAARPASQTTPARVPAASSSTRPSSSASTTQPSAKPAKPAVADETPVAPSLDFLKWLKEALKGLNGINVEEFMQMLLSFPLDPSPAVIEIISDSIYANSSTLDGRRFAAEFCQKRKADAAAARAKPGSASGAKVPRTSLAEVVKTQPKPVQSEWGFKTVQKKAKGGRK